MPAPATPSRSDNPEQTTDPNHDRHSLQASPPPKGNQRHHHRPHPRSYHLVDFLKLFREDACFDSAEWLFHNFAPPKEKHFCPFAVVFSGTLRSVLVFRRQRVEHCEFLLKRLLKYCGVSSLSDLKTIVFDSLLMSCSMIFQPNLSMSGLFGVSKLLFVTIQAAPF